MQREKLFNLQGKAYFNCTLFIFKKKGKFCATNFPVAKKLFFLPE